MATYQNAYLIYNPFAGKLTRSKSLLQRTTEELRRCGHRITLIPTHGPRTAAGLARGAIESGADLILAAGGDGTINEVVNGMIGSLVPLGILPGGTANVLACELGFNIGMERAAKRLSSCVPARISVGQISREGESPRSFLLMAGVGLDAFIVYSLNAALKATLGKVAYWIGGFGQVGKRLPEFELLMQGKRYRASFALASRVRNYGGDLTIAQQASLLRDDFAVVLFEGPSTLPYLRYFLGVLTNRMHSVKGITLHHASNISIVRVPDSTVFVQVDGECAGNVPAELCMVRDALTLLVPPEFRG